MLRHLVVTLLIAVNSIVLAQTSGNETSHAEQHGVFRLEHADVPLYPQKARVARMFGTVEVQVTVKDGDVVKTEVKSSPKGPAILTQATIDNIQTWRFNKLDNGIFTTKFVYKLETQVPFDPLNSKVELQLPLLVKITAVPVQLDSQ